MSVQIKNILMPTDFSDLSLAALGHAQELSKAFGATVHCLHVIDEAYHYCTSMSPESIPMGPPPEQFIELARARMERFEHDHFGEAGVNVKTAVILGRPFIGIIQYARDNDVDMIVMATHGRGAIAHVLLGSTTEKVVRKAPCAVLTVRAGEHDFVMP